MTAAEGPSLTTLNKGELFASFDVDAFEVPRSRRSGVNRQISSRPCGTSKASTSNDANSSPLFSTVDP